MKKFKKMTAILMVGLIFISLPAIPVKAVEKTPNVVDVHMEQLRAEDDGPDLSEGVLISEYWGTEEDGTPFVERKYLSVPSIITYANSNPVTYTNVKNYGTTGKVKVTAKFGYNTAEQKAWVISYSGSYYDRAGISGTKNEEVRIIQNNLPMAVVGYSIDVNRNVGGWATYFVNVSCDYKGN